MDESTEYPTRIRLEVNMDSRHVEALAQFLSRLSYSHFRSVADSVSDCYRMRDAVQAFKDILQQNGY